MLLNTTSRFVVFTTYQYSHSFFLISLLYMKWHFFTNYRNNIEYDKDKVNAQNTESVLCPDRWVT